MLPEIRLSDSLILPSYIVYLSLLFTLMVAILPWYSMRKHRDLREALNIALIMMLTGFIGARLFHVFYEEWPLYREQPERILYVWLGGFVFLGGAIPAAFAAALYLRWKKLPFDVWADFFTPVVAIGYGLGRISCFLSGCCYGVACDLPWAVAGRHPTQLYATIWELTIIGMILLFQKRILQKLKVGGIFWTWVFLHAVGRLFIEGLRDDFRGPIIFGYSISSCLSLLLIAASFSQILLRSLQPAISVHPRQRR